MSTKVKAQLQAQFGGNANVNVTANTAQGVTVNGEVATVTVNGVSYNVNDDKVLDKVLKAYHKAQISESKFAAEKKAQGEVAKAILDARGVDFYVGKGCKAIYREQTRNAFDTDAFKRELPELYARYATPKTSRPLRVS